MELDVSVILVNYNSSAYTIQCVDSIIKKTDPSLNYEIIIVDNASKLEDYNQLKTRIKILNNDKIILKRSLLNVGFGSGNNLGAKEASGKLLAFINNDTILENDCLLLIYEYFKLNKALGICSPQQYNEHGKVQKSFDHFLSLKRELFGRKFLQLLNPKRYPERKKIYEEPVKVESVPGSFMVVFANSFKQVNGFDPNIFLYYEETDLCYRISKLSTHSECWLFPRARYIHFKGKSTNKNFAIKKELKISLFYVLGKNSGAWQALILRIWLGLKYLIKSIAKPNNFKMFLLMLEGAPLSASLKHKQKKLTY